MTEADFRNAIRGVLRQHNAAVEAAIRREFAEPIELEPDGRLQFEVDPHSSSIHLVQTEEGIFGGASIPDSLLDAGDKWDVDLWEMLNEALFPWLADRWQAVGGPDRFSRAYAYYHGGLYQPRYHLEQRRWCPAEEVWPGG